MKPTLEQRKALYAKWSTQALMDLYEDLRHIIDERMTEKTPVFHRSRDTPR